MIQAKRPSLSTLFKGIALCAAIAMGATYYYYYYSHAQVEREAISDYQDARDKKDILTLFESERYWLTATEDYDAVFALDNRAPNERDSRYYGALKIKVLREDDKFVGFIAYYRKTLTEGFILFVSVRPELRGKRYAEKLMKYAENDLRSMGVSMINLVTRTTNHRAQALYNRLGFHVINVDQEGGFVYFMKVV